MTGRPLAATRRALISRAALVLLGAALPGIGEARDAGTLVVSQSSDALTLDASMDTSPISLNLFKNIYDQLTDIAGDGSVSPQLATSWQASSDATVWTF